MGLLPTPGETSFSGIAGQHKMDSIFCNVLSDLIYFYFNWVFVSLFLIFRLDSGEKEKDTHTFTHTERMNMKLDW